MSPLTRRQLLLGSAATAAGAAVGRAAASPRPARLITPATLPSPNASGLDHIVVVVMENRSFDHYLGWMASEPKFGTVEGKQAGLTYVDSNGAAQSTYRLAVRQGCGLDDPDHSYGGGRVQLNGGGRGGFAQNPPGTLPPRYHTRRHLPLFRGAPGKAGVS